jgi:hypothetical protein
MPRSATLADLVAPVGVSQFRATIAGRRHHLFDGRRGRFAELLPWPAVNAILRQHRPAFPRLRLARDGVVVPVEAYVDEVPARRGGTIPRLLPGPLAKQLRDGATLVVDAVEELSDPVGDLAARLEHDLREHVQVNAYASWGTTHGFDVHWDDHDVFVLQVAGRKRWRIHGPTRPFPMHRDVAAPARPAGDPVAGHTLVDGDVLYVPRGHWHDVSAVGEPALHLTFGFAPATGVDLAAWLADRLRADERFRRDLPRFAPAAERAALAATLAEALGELLGPDTVDRFLADRDANAPARPWVGLPWSARPELLPPADEAEVRLLTPRALVERRDDGTVALLAAGRRLVFGDPAGPVLEALLDGCPRPMKALFDVPGSALDPATVRGLLAELAANGLLAAD